MKKTLQRFFMSALMAVMATVTAHAQCYILGNDNQGDPSHASVELPQTSTEGVYEGDVTFTNQYFCVGTKLGANGSDWATFNAHRYGPSTQNSLLVLNEPTSVEIGRDASFMVPSTGTTYRLRVDLNNKQVTLLGTYPDKLYVIGGENGWQPGIPEATLLPIDGEDGVYQGTVDLLNSKEFVVSSTFGDWETVSQSKYYSTNVPLKVNRKNPLYKFVSYGENLTVPYNATFRITVDLTDMTIEAYDPNYVPEYPEALYIHGADGTDSPSEAMELQQTTTDGVYYGWVNFTSSRFSITTDIADSWDNLSFVGPAEDGALVQTERTVQLTRERNTFNVSLGGEQSLYACMTVDLRKNRLTVFGNDEQYPEGYPNELYVIGCDKGWNVNIASEVIPETEEPGVYEGEITFTGGKDDADFGLFAVLQRLGMNWDWINAKRLSPYSDGDWIALGDYASVYTGSDNPGAWKFTGDPGTYKIKVDISGTGYVLISEKPATGISAAPTTTAATKTFYYDLNGRFLGNTEPQKGTFVVKGKKVKR